MRRFFAPQKLTVGQSTVLTGSDADNDPLTFAVASQPANGTLSGTAPNLTYTPNSGFTGSDSFAFVVNDSQDDSAPATVSITVNPDVRPSAERLAAERRRSISGV